MGEIDGFLKYDRELPGSRDPKERIKDYKEIYVEFPEKKTKEQAARCMDCGVPFCHNGCPLGNIIPEFNEAVTEENWEDAINILSSTNNFPEFTGRICPAPCEASCVLGINKPPVAIEHIEKNIAEKAFELGYIKPQIPEQRTGKSVAVIGSGPAGLAAAAQLNKAGHKVTVFERAEQAGGLLRYGIPDFKLEKWVVERRVDVMKEEGIVFKTNTTVGANVKAAEILQDFDSVVICTGATVPRDLPITGRDASSVHFAMDFLGQQNKEVGAERINEERISAKGKNVLVIGGGDTGSDCIGTSHRQGAESVTQIEVMPKPQDDRTEADPWPLWPMILRTSSSHEEGGEREWSILTKSFNKNESGDLESVTLASIEWYVDEAGKRVYEEVEGTEKTIPCELALLAIGFVSPERGLLDQFGLEVNERGNVKDSGYKTSVEKVFAAGDARRGQSLVVWAIAEGREAAKACDEFLMGESTLESRDASLVGIV